MSNTETSREIKNITIDEIHYHEADSIFNVYVSKTKALDMIRQFAIQLDSLDNKVLNFSFWGRIVEEETETIGE